VTPGDNIPEGLDHLAGPDEYSSLLIELARDLPRVAAPLRRAEANRRQKLLSYLRGARFKGVEELLLYLDRVAEIFAGDNRLERAAGLIERLIRDFETAVEATLSGYTGVMSDAMRDVIEIERLLLDFAVEPERLDLWFEADSETRWEKFRPERVRKRLEARGAGEIASSVNRADYAGHSQAVHVTPSPPLVGNRGLEREDTGFFADAGFWEIFEHGGRALVAITAVRMALTGDDDQLAPLDRFRDARTRTQEMQDIALAMLLGPSELRNELGREPTHAELLAHVRRKLANGWGQEEIETTD